MAGDFLMFHRSCGTIYHRRPLYMYKASTMSCRATDFKSDLRRGDITMKENFQLKMYLILQSFSPLFLLILIQHFRFDFFQVVSKFFRMLFFDWSNIGEVLLYVISYGFLGDLMVSIICFVWLGGAFVIWVGFRGFQADNFDSHGEKINIEENALDVGASYFVTFTLPLLIDDVNTIRGFAVFVLLLLMLILLIARSDLFYQNPVLATLKYKVFRFKFVNPYDDIELKDKTYIGIYKDISKNALKDVNSIIKRKFIANDVFLISKD